MEDVDEGLPQQSDEDDIKIDFENFEVQSEIGKGSFGVYCECEGAVFLLGLRANATLLQIVFKASYFGSEVALKQLNYPEDTPDFSYEKYIKREVAVLRYACALLGRGYKRRDMV